MTVETCGHVATASAGVPAEALPPPSRSLRTASWGLSALNRLTGRGRHRPGPPRKILVVRRGFIGDIIQTTATVADLRRAYPEAEIVYMTGAAGAEVLAGNRSLTRVEPYLEEPSGGARSLARLWRAARGLRRERFDLGLCLNHKAWDALLLRLAGVAWAAGFTEPGREFLLDRAVRWDEWERRPGQDRYDELLRSLDIEPQCRSYGFPAVPEGDAAGQELLPGVDFTEAPLLVLAPGGGRHPNGCAPYRQWAPERFAEVAGVLAEEWDCEVCLIGGAEDADVTQQVLEHMPGTVRTKAHDLAGRTSLGQVGRLLSSARLLIANDSAPVWIAAAVGCPVVAIFGCNHPADYRPLAPAYVAVCADLTCHPCFSGARVPQCELPARCLAAIGVDEVVRAARVAVSLAAGGRWSGSERLEPGAGCFTIQP